MVENGQSGDVAKVENQRVAQWDRLLHQSLVREHFSGDEIPGGPQLLPFFQTRQRGRGVVGWM